MSTHGVPEIIKQLWESVGGAQIFSLKNSTELNAHLYSLFLKDKDAILTPHDLCLGCMDEGVYSKAVGLGGPGIVLSYFIGKKAGKGGWEAVQAGMKTVATVLQGEVSTITSHAGCGASGIIYRFLHEDEQKQFPETDDVAIRFAKELAIEMGVEYKHIGWDGMKRPIEGHPARMVCYTGTRYLNIDICLPEAFSFTISRGLLEKIEDAEFSATIGKLLLETACTIATGDHGLGELASNETPFFILPVGGDMLPLETIKKEADEIAGKFGGRVQVLDGFTL